MSLACFNLAALLGTITLDLGINNGDQEYREWVSWVEIFFQASAPKQHVETILRGLHGKKIGGTAYGVAMPPFAQLSDQDIAAIIDYERTSWEITRPPLRRMTSRKNDRLQSLDRPVFG